VLRQLHSKYDIPLPEVNLQTEDSAADPSLLKAQDWWQTAIVDIEPGVIRLRGYPIEELIGNVSYAQTVWLMLRGDLPTDAQAKLLEAALVAAVDHGPQAPSIAIARMAVTCGIGLQNAIASGVNTLGDVHGGAGEACLQLLAEIENGLPTENIKKTLQTNVRSIVNVALAGRNLVPGFGHRFHPVDPRVPRLTELMHAATDAGVISGRFLEIALMIETTLAECAGRHIPMNIDGITAAVYAELGFAPPLARGLFVLSRSVGLLAHAWEQLQQGGRIKGPIPPQFLYSYTGQGERHVPST
jgi:citrate synthase